MGRATMSTPSVQTFGKKRSATAVAHVKAGKGLIKVNGSPITLVQPEILRFKVYEPLTLVGLDKFQNIDIRVKVSGGGHVSQVYAIRQAIAKGLIAYHQKYVDEASKNELKKVFASYDKTLLVADSRRMEPKKFGGRGARARFQKSYRKEIFVISFTYSQEKGGNTKSEYLHQDFCLRIACQIIFAAIISFARFTNHHSSVKYYIVPFFIVMCC